MRITRHPHRTLSISLLAIGLVAVGGAIALSRSLDDGITVEDRIAEAVRRPLPSRPDLALSHADATCVVDRLLADAPPERLRELARSIDGEVRASLTAPPLTDHERELVLVGVRSCVDVRGLLLGAYAADASIPASTAECAARRVANDDLLWRAMFRAPGTDSDRLRDLELLALAECDRQPRG